MAIELLATGRTYMVLKDNVVIQVLVDETFSYLMKGDLIKLLREEDQEILGNVFKTWIARDGKGKEIRLPTGASTYLVPVKVKARR